MIQRNNVSAARLAGLPTVARYGIGVAIYAAALAARFALIGILPPEGFPFLTFFPAVMFTAYFAGLRPGLMVAALSTLSANYFFIAPLYAFSGISRGDTIALVVFAGILVLDCVILHLMNGALAKVRDTRDQLKDSESKFRALADNIPQMTWMADPGGNAYWYNQRWFEFAGGDQTSAKTDWRLALHPEHARQVSLKFQQNLQSELPWEDTFPLRRHDGQYCWFLTRAVPVRTEGGHIERWFGTHTDVTERINNEQLLRERHEQLLARETVLEAADRSKNIFIATLAHELRNPLAPIRVAAQMLKTNHQDADKVARCGAIIDRQSAQLARLVDDLLDVSRITSGKLTLRLENVDLRSVVESAVETCRPLLDRSGHHFQLTLPDQPVTVYVDETRISQCVSNLVNNAIKFTAGAGVISVDVSVLPDNTASILVKDNGRGISAEMLPKLFDFFEQENVSGTDGNTGLGIGLALTRSLLEQHRGRVFATSAGPGCGAEFEVFLPLEEATQNAPNDAIAERADHGSGLILIVEDNVDTALILKDLLELEQFSVMTTNSGLTAMDVIGRRQPQVVLLDIGLPDISGYELARRMRAIEAPGTHALLIAVTGWDDANARAESKNAGIDHHMKKPADIPRLLDHIRRHLDTSDQIRTQQDSAGLTAWPLETGTPVIARDGDIPGAAR